VTGLVVPSGVATSAATVLALNGQFDFAPILLAASAGGFVGDSVGFWIGRVARGRVLAGKGSWTMAIARRRESASGVLDRHPVYSVTVARLIVFVRTLMPMAAGMSDLTYRRYLPFEVMGLLGWVVIYVSIGVLAGESWEVVTRLVGVWGAPVFAAAGVVLWLILRREGRDGAPAPASEAP